MIDDLSSIEEYIKTLSWVSSTSSSNIIKDLLSITSYIRSDHDSYTLTSNWRRAKALLTFWLSYVEEQLEINSFMINRVWSSKQPDTRRTLINNGLTITADLVSKYIFNDEEYFTLKSNSATLSRLANTLRGLIQSIDESVVVQESVNLRKHESEDKEAI